MGGVPFGVGRGGFETRPLLAGHLSNHGQMGLLITLADYPSLQRFPTTKLIILVATDTGDDVAGLLVAERAGVGG